MTHGEVWYLNKCKLQELETLDAEDAINKMKLPQKMSKADASKYYNKKLFNYWVTCIQSDIELQHKKEILSALMFGHTKAYKKYEEEKK